MAFRDLHQFVAHLEKQHHLVRVRAEVDPHLELAEITDRVVKAGGPALLFENVKGSSMPVLINAFGAEQRMCWGLGVDRLDDLGDKVARLMAMDLPNTLGDKLKRLMDVSEVVRFRPKLTDKPAPCQEVIDTVTPSLAGLPILTCWPGDGGRYITLPLVFTRDPATGRRNVGCYRLQVYDDQKLGMHWHIHKGGAEHFRHGQEEGRRLPVAIALGGDPVSMYSGTCPLPPIVDEMLFAGWLRHESVEMVKCQTIDLEVPAHAEIVLEGYVDPDERRVEGPFGDHTGFYSLEDEYPVFHLTAVTRRRDAIYPTIIVGRPPMEDVWMGKATERMFLPLVKMVHPEIEDMTMPFEGGFHGLVIVSVKKSYPGQVRKVMYGIWSMGLMMLVKNVIVVDAGVNIHDPSELAWRVVNNVDARRDVVIVDGPLDALDHASPQSHYGAKLGIDATVKGPMDGHSRPWPEEVVMSPEVKDLVSRRWREYGIRLPG
jgi:4-hydroxy-3-polyprenylbenzoate decarboxylase